MKKIISLTLLLALGSLMIVSCGPKGSSKVDSFLDSYEKTIKDLSKATEIKDSTQIAKYIGDLTSLSQKAEDLQKTSKWSPEQLERLSKILVDYSEVMQKQTQGN